MDSLQMGRVDGEPIIGHHVRPYDGDPHTADVGAGAGRDRRAVRGDAHLRPIPARARSAWTSRSGRAPSPTGLRRGTMRAGHEIIWDQSHMFQSGTYNGTYTVGGHDVRGRRLVGPARPLVGHPRPRPLPAVVVVPGPAARRVPRRVALGVRQRRARVHRRLLGADRRQRSGAARRLPPRARVGRRRRQAGASYGEHGETVTGLRGTATFVARGRAPHRRSRPKAASTGPYEPFQRGGLNQMMVRTDDGRRGHRDLRGDRLPPPPLLPRHHSPGTVTVLRRPGCSPVYESSGAGRRSPWLVSPSSPKRASM